MKITTFIKDLHELLDLRPIALLVVMYGLVQWVPFGIFGWLQNEDGLMEWGSVAAMALSAINAYRLLRKTKTTRFTRLCWIAFILICIVFIGEEISWGERLHGVGIEAIRDINTQGETNLHNITHFQNSYGLLHLGWAFLGFVLGTGGWIWSDCPLLPSKRFCLYFLIPSIWYLGFEFCRHQGSCWLTIPNHQEIFEFMIAIGLYVHTRLWCKRSGIPTRLFSK